MVRDQSFFVKLKGFSFLLDGVTLRESELFLDIKLKNYPLNGNCPDCAIEGT